MERTNVYEKKLKHRIFEIILNISKSVHQFKFIVDKKWVCSPNYRTIKENNNINNTIDLTKFDPNIKNDNESLNFKESKKKKKQQIKKDNVEYNCSIPKLKDVNEEAQVVPIHYKYLFDLNNQTNQNNKYDFNHKYFK